MKYFFIGLSVFFLVSCASTSDVKDIERQVQEGQKTIVELDNKIALLEIEKSNLATKLHSIDSNGQSLKSEAAELRGKISKIDQSIGSYKKEINTVNSLMAKNSENISLVQQQQQSQHVAASVAVKDNEALKSQAIDEIKALELEYEKKRQQANEDQKADNEGE